MHNPQPTAHITKNRNRIKTYSDKVYLKDGSSFEIELFNPKSTSVLAKIWINGQLLSSAGLILKPGQRVYLERFIDVAKKFLFETYEVDSKSKDVQAAIAQNGKIQVHFHDEVPYNAGSTLTFDQLWMPGSVVYGSNTLTNNVGLGTVNCFYSSATPTVGANFGSATITSTGGAIPSEPKMEETGRIEKGANSDQKFETGYGEYQSYSCAWYNWQILPESKKPVEAGEIRQYCSNCGTRHKKSTWKFCPNCGTPVNE